jgi:hypothetical protein
MKIKYYTIVLPVALIHFQNTIEMNVPLMLNTKADVELNKSIHFNLNQSENYY